MRKLKRTWYDSIDDVYYWNNYISVYLDEYSKAEKAGYRKIPSFHEWIKGRSELTRDERSYVDRMYNGMCKFGFPNVVLDQMVDFFEYECEMASKTE